MQQQHLYGMFSWPLWSNNFGGETGISHPTISHSAV